MSEAQLPTAAVLLPCTDLAGWGHPVMSRQANGCPRPVSAGATVSTMQPRTTSN